MASVLLLFIGLVAPGAGVRQALSSPALETVPSPVAPTAGLPAPATWPVLRHERRLRFLAILDQRDQAAPYQRIARRLNASLELGFLAGEGKQGPDAIYTLSHTNDKWIEAAKDPSAQEVADHARVRLREALAAGTYDAVFSGQLWPELAEYVKRGGVWVVCGKVVPDDKSPLAPLWPGRPTGKNSWHDKGAQRGAAPEVAGLPLERLAGWQYHGIYEAAEGAEALATGQSGAAFLRRVGKGAILLVPSGPISKRHDAIESLHRAYDHDEIWLRFWDQVLHGLTSGGEALPVVADLRSAEKEAAAGQDCTLPGNLLNRGKAARQVAVSVHVVSPSGQVVYAGQPRDVPLAPGGAREWNVTLPVAADWPTGLYAVHLTVGDPAAKKQLHQALAYVPVAGSVKLSLKADKPGYRIGEPATFTVEAAAAAAWQGDLRWAVHDFRGRQLGAGVLPADLAAGTKTIPFTWAFADHGVRVDTVWVTAVAVKDGREWARAECKVYKHERWNMCNEYQWSTWSHMACHPPSVVVQAMRLMAHAGMNALGYPAGGRELFYPAERWSWRIYDEGVGSNTGEPLIESVTDAEIEAAQRRKPRPSATLKSGATVLASVGEEAGFKSGWGRTYYWDGPVASEKACQAFQRFLRERYPSLEILNAAWGTRYRAWDEIKLTREFSGKSPTLAADGWAHPKDSPLGDGVKGVSLAPFTDTMAFYHWYYDKVVGAALKILRDEINPVPLTMASAPSSWIFESPRTDVRLAGGGGWTDSQDWSQRSANGRDPGFGIAWGHYDWPVASENVLWSWIIGRNGHNDYWVDVPLMFNPDMTLTRGAWAIRRWRTRTAHAERLLLDAAAAPSDVGVLTPTGSFLPRTPGEIANSVKIALSQGGFAFADADPQAFGKHKIVFAVFRNQVSQAEADALSAYAERGGTLVFSPRFAGLNEYGVPQETVPGFGLAKKWGVKVIGKNDPIPQRYSRDKVRADLSGLGAAFAGLPLESQEFLNEKVEHAGWIVLASYPDRTPALLARPFGKGRLIYLNAAYQSQWYIQHVTPTDVARQGFYRLIEKLCLDAGARRTFRIDGDLAQVLHVAALQWTDPSGKIGYVVTRTNGQTIWTGGKLAWLGPQTAAYDVYGGDPAAPAPTYGREVALQLRPGAGRLLAFTPAPVKTIKVVAGAAKLTAGDPLAVTVEILDAAGQPVPGRFPVEIRVAGPAGEVAGLRRDLSLASGETVRIATALNDPAGPWTITVRDGISRLTGRAAVEVAAAAAAATAPAFLPWGWPSENWEPERMPAAEFVATLKRLADVYRTDHAKENWRAKQWLGAHYCFFPGTRHALLRNLIETDWPRHAETLRQAVADGANLILVGEDLGLDPATGLPAWPADGQQLEAVAAAMRSATWESLSGDGEVIRASLGRGSLVLCRNTPDGAGSSWGAAVAWQQDFLRALAAKPAGGIPVPDAARLARWLAGCEALKVGPRTAVWQGGWEAEQSGTPVWRNEWTAKIDPAKDKPGPVFVLRLPPTGVVREAALELAVTGKGAVTMDVGANGTAQVECRSGPATVSLKPETIAAYLAWREQDCGGVERDLNGWRLVPIRFGSGDEATVAVQRAKVIME